MLEKQLSVLLATYLNQFICDLNEEQLRVSLWSGDLVLRDLELRSNIVDQIALSLFQGHQENGNNVSERRKGNVDAAKATAQALMFPLTVVKGVVKELVISVPWSAIDREPISVEVRGVEIVFSLLRSKPYNADEDANRVFVVKQKQLKMFETERLRSMHKVFEQATGSCDKFGDIGRNEKTQLSYVERLTETIKRNIHIVLRDVSLRYIVDYPDLAPCLACALVVCLESVYITTTDEEWEDRFIVDLSMPYCKKVLAKGVKVSLYAIKNENKDEKNLQGDASSSWQKRMDLVEIEDIAILLRLSEEEEEVVNMNSTEQTTVSIMTKAPIKLQASFGALGTLAIVNDTIKNGLLGLNYRHHLHLLVDNEKETYTLAQRRWRFALCCVLEDVGRSKNKGKEHQCFIDGVLLFGKRRREYCTLWKRSQSVPWLPPLLANERSALEELERVLTLEQLVFLRCLAYAELSEEKQKMTQQKLYIEDAIKRKQSTNESDVSGGSRLWRWWWFGGRHPNEGVSVALDDVHISTAGGGGFVTEWAFGYQFLQTMVTRRMNPSMIPSSSEIAATSVSTKPISVMVTFPEVEVMFYPYVWRSKVMAKNSLLSYVENLQQYVEARFNSVKCKYAMNANPHNDRVGFSFSIHSATVNFAGSLPCPFLSMPEVHEGEKEENDLDKTGSSSHLWLTVAVNETCSVVTACFAPTCITIQPFCEPWWWMGAIQEFLNVLPQYTQKGPVLCEQSKMHNHSPSLPILDIKVNKIIFTIPLISGEVKKSDLVLIVPHICMITMEPEQTERKIDHTMQELPITLKWHFSAGGDKPICLICEEIGNVIVLSFVKINMTFTEQWSIFIRTRAEVTINPTLLNLISKHMETLFLPQLEIGKELLRLVDENEGKWHLESHEALVVGNFLMTFPFTQSRAYLLLLYQTACVKETVYGKASTSSCARSTLPLLYQIVLNIDFAHAIVQNMDYETVVEVELPGMITTDDDETFLFQHSLVRNAFTLNITLSETYVYNSVICLPDVHITAPSGQHVFVLENSTISFHVSSASISIEVETAQVVFCRSLVDCVEVLVISYALLQEPITESTVVLCPGEPEIIDTSMSLNSTRNTFRIIEVNVKQMTVCFQLGQVNENAVAHLHNLSLCVDSLNKGQNFNLQGVLESLNYIAEDVDELKTFALLAPSCGIFGDTKEIAFNCSIENTVDIYNNRQSRISFHTTGGRMNLFYAYWLRLATLPQNSIILDLLTLVELLGQRQNISAITSLLSFSSFNHKMFHHSVSVKKEKHSPIMMIISGEINELEFLLATNVHREIDVFNYATYSYFLFQKMEFSMEMSRGQSSDPNANGCVGDFCPFIVNMKLHNVYHFFSGNSKDELLLCIKQASLCAENYTRLVQNTDRSSYEYIKGGKRDVAMHMMIGPLCGENNGAELPAEAALDIKLTMAMLQKFLLALFCNILNKAPVTDYMQSVEATDTLKSKLTLVKAADALPEMSSSSLSTYMLITISSARFVFVNERDVFVMRAQFQFFLCSGGEEGRPIHIVHIKALTVDDISPGRRVVERDVPRWKQQQQQQQQRELQPNDTPSEAHSSGKKRMLVVENGCICAVKSAPGVIDATPMNTTEVVLENVTLCTAHSSWTTLLGILFSGGSLDMLRNEISHVDSNVSSTPSVFTVVLRECNVYVEEPWEEPLAQLLVRSVTARIDQCATERILTIWLDEPVSLTPCFTDAVEISILQWEDLKRKLSLTTTTTTTTREELTYLYIKIKQQNEKQHYQFDTPYAEMPEVCCSNYVEVTLNSMRLIAGVDVLTRLLRFVLSETAVYTSLLYPTTTAVSLKPTMSLPLITVIVKDIQILLPTAESTQTTRWRLSVQYVDVRNEFAKMVVSNMVPSRMGCMYCFSNVYTVNISGARFACEGLYPLLLPNILLGARFPIPQSTFNEWQASVSVTQDDRAHVQSTYTFVSMKALTVCKSMPTFCRFIHMKTDENTRFFISALHVRDALHTLPLTYMNAEPPLYYATQPETNELSVYTTSSITVELPRLSFCLTEGGQAVNIINTGENEKERNCDSSVLAELRFLGVMTLAASFAAREKMPVRGYLTVKGPFELVDGNGNVVLFRHYVTNMTNDMSSSRHIVTTEDVGFQFEVLDTPQERRMSIELHGITILLHPSTLNFVRLIQNFIALMYYEGAIGGKDNRVKTVVNNGSHVDASPHVYSQNKKPTTLTFCISEISVVLEHTARLEARNMKAHFSWDDISQTDDDNSKPYNFTLGELLLLQSNSQLAFVSLSSLDVSLGVGHVNIRAKPFIINNYDMLFYVDLCNSARGLYAYIIHNFTLSKKHEDGFKQSVVVNLMDVRVCFFLFGQSITSSASGGGVEIVFPVVILKKIGTTAGYSFTFETEKGIIRYRSPQGLLPPFLRNMSFTCFMEKNVVAQSQSIVTHLGSVEAFIPLGDILQCCVEAVAQVLLPLLSFPFTACRRRQDDDDDDESNNNNNNNNLGSGAADILLTSVSSDKFVFSVPLVTLNVCASQSEEEALVENPAVLFGVSFHNVFYERSRSGWNEKTLLQILSVNSTVDTVIQKEFVSATAPSGALDEPSKWAVYFCKEIFSGKTKYFSPSLQSNDNTNNIDDGDDDDVGDNMISSEHLPARVVRIIARAHAVKMTVSPKLLAILNEHVLLNVKSGVHRTWERKVQWTWPCNRRDTDSLWSYRSFGDHNDRVVTITSETCLKASLTLGGKRGFCLRFAKGSVDTNPKNKLTLLGINHAKVYVSMFVASDGSLEPPIVVDPGLTVVVEDVPFVIKHGKLTDYVKLGERSFFLAPTELISTTIEDRYLDTAITATIPNIDVPLGPARWYNMKICFDMSMDVALCLWSRQQTIAVSSEAYARYKLEKNCFEGNRGVRDFIDEYGEVALSNVSILCDSGFITRDPTGLVVHVKHHKLHEDHTNAGMTVIRAILPTTSFTLTVGNLQLLCDTFNQLRQGLNYIGSTMDMTTGSETVHNQDKPVSFCPSRPSYHYFGNINNSSSVEQSLLWSRDGEVIPLIEFGVSAPRVELILTNNFYKPEVTIELSNIALLSRGNRSFDRMTWTASTNIRVTDYPQYQLSRDIVIVSPELAVEYMRYNSGGFSLQGALTCPEASVTIPLVTALRILRVPSFLHCTGAYSFCNRTGIPLLLLAVAGANKKNQEEINPLCSLPPEKLVKTGLFHYNQTRFRIIPNENGDIVEHHEAVNTFGTEVNLSALQRGATYRFPLAMHSTGVLDVVMRLNELERIVEITSSVEVKNELAEHVICFSEALTEPFLVKPKETRYATLSCMRKPFLLRVGEWQTKMNNELLTLELLITAFILLSDECKRTWTNGMDGDGVLFPRRTYMEGDNTLVVPLTLTKDHQHQDGTIKKVEINVEKKEEEESFCVLLVLTRKVALESTPRTSRFLPRYEVELRVFPLVTVLNETGTELAVNIISFTTKNALARELTFLRGEEVFNCFSYCCKGETPMMNLICKLADGVQLSSIDPLPLNFRGTMTVPMGKTVDGYNASGGPVAALLVERGEHGKFIVRVAAILVNRLPFSVCVYDQSNALVLGQKSKEGLEPGHKLPVMFPVSPQHQHQHHLQSDNAVMIRVSTKCSSAKTSPQFACNAPTLSCMLHSEDGDLVRIFRAHRVGGITKIFANTPVVRFEPMWVFRNQSHVLPLTVRCVGLSDVVTIEPQSTKEWETFSILSAADPLLQVRYGGDGEEELFMWSEPVELVTLSSSNVPIVMKHYTCEKTTECKESLPPSSLLKAGVTLFSSVRVPMMVEGKMTCERFACLSITPWRQNNLFVVDFSLDNNIPIVVENRTGWSLQHEQVQKPLSGLREVAIAYSIEPFSDGVACFEGPNTAPIMRLTLFRENGSSMNCVINLKKAAAAREAVRTSHGMSAFCTYDHNLQRYYVSVTTDRSLESTLLFQPRYIIHVEAFIRALSMHIASICVPKRETSLGNTPLAALIAKNQIRLDRANTTEESTNAELLSVLKCRELDVILVKTVGIYSALSVNEKHCFGRLDIGRLALIDCTTPCPIYPVIVSLNGGEESVNLIDSKSARPSVSVSVHILSSTEVVLSEKGLATQKTLTIPVQHFRVDVAPVTVKLADPLLFLLRQVGICVLETINYTETTSKVQKSEEEGDNHVGITATIPLEETFLYKFYIAHLHISRIDLELTLTRRSDGRFNPFTGLNFGSRLIPSVERAPLSIGEVKRKGVSQRGSSPLSVLLAMLWPSYRSQLMLQFYKIIGSMKVFGNPIALISGWRRGVHSFVVETADMNPMKGAHDFLLATASSTLHSVGLLSRVGSRTAATISWDNEWLETRGEEGRNGHFVNQGGILRGAAQGLLDGIEGVVSRPLNGARTAGFTGFCTGVAAGAVGLLTRPVAGVLDGFGNTAEFYSRLLQEPDQIPNAHTSYLKSERNFNAVTITSCETANVPVDVFPSERKRNFFFAKLLNNTTGHTVLSDDFLPGLKRGVRIDTGACEFVSRATFDLLRQSTKSVGAHSEEVARFLMDAAGVHNYALYAEWTSFVQYTTPEDFYNWVYVALAAVLRKELVSFLAFNDDSEGVSPSSSLLPQRSQDLTIMIHSDQEVGTSLERARVIKKTLGTRDMLKYVSPEDFVLVSSLEEIRQCVSPNIMQKNLSRILFSGVMESFGIILRGGVDH